MKTNIIRRFVCNILLKRITNRCLKNNVCNCQSQSIIVFSPHFDDETLGCGGTIIKKKISGANVVIVFMTDGSTSHRKFLTETELKQMREKEGISAAAKLGIDQKNVILFRYKEAQLFKKEEEAEIKVIELLKDFEPDEVYIPHSCEPKLWSLDHIASSRIVKKALSRYQKAVLILEYPIWYWYHWPWVYFYLKNRESAKIIGKNTIVNMFGLRTLHDFNECIFIKDVLVRKRKALEQHRTQMFRIIDDNEWPTLPDIADGEFLKCFFRNYEYFYRYKINY